MNGSIPSKLSRLSAFRSEIRLPISDPGAASLPSDWPKQLGPEVGSLRPTWMLT